MLGWWLMAAMAGSGGELALQPTIDGPVLMTTAAYSVTSLFLLPDRPALLVAVAPAPLGFDAIVAGRAEGEGAVLLGADVLSYGGTFLGMVAAPAYGALDFGPDGSRGGGRGAVTHGVIFAESVTVAVTLTELIKSASPRPRPYTRVLGYELEEVDDQMSFPSGHTSASAAFSFSLAHQIVRTQDLSSSRKIGAYGLATAYTATTGLLRVAAAKHYPSDVVVGGLLGATIGIVVPELHRASGLRVSAIAEKGARGVALSGRL